MNKIKTLYFFLFFTFSNAFAQQEVIPPYALTPPSRVFKAIAKEPTFQGGQKGFQRWVKFALPDTLLIQSMLQKGSLKVIWTVRPTWEYPFQEEKIQLQVLCADTIIQQQILHVFKKMPMWVYHSPDWCTTIGTDTLAVARINSTYENTIEKLPAESRVLNPNAPMLLFQYQVPNTIKPFFECHLNAMLSYDCKKTFPDSLTIKSHQVYKAENGYFTQNMGCLFWYVPSMQNQSYDAIDVHLEDYLAERGKFNPEPIVKDPSAFLKKLKKLMNAKEMEVTWELAPYRDLTNKVQVMTFSKRANRFRPEVERVLTEFKAHRLYMCKIGRSYRALLRLGKDLEIWLIQPNGF